MAGLDNPNGSPFMVGDKQREWLKKDLAKVNKDTPIVVFSHSPLQKIYKGWNFWTEDAEQVQALLTPFDKVNGALRPRAPDPVQPDRQHRVHVGDGDRVAVAVSADAMRRPRATCRS